jgi:hypothetical protein
MLQSRIRHLEARLEHNLAHVWAEKPSAPQRMAHANPVQQSQDASTLTHGNGMTPPGTVDALQTSQSTSRGRVGPTGWAGLCRDQYAPLSIYDAVVQGLVLSEKSRITTYGPITSSSLINILTDL